LASTQAQLATAQATIAATAQICTDVSSCHTDLVNETSLKLALEKATNGTVSESLVTAVKNIIQDGLDSGKCSEASDRCISGTCPVTECPTCPEVKCNSSARTSPQLLVISAVIAGNYILSHSELMDNPLSSAVSLVKRGVARLTRCGLQKAIEKESAIEKTEVLEATE
jgi:hypothetical protein